MKKLFPNRTRELEDEIEKYLSCFTKTALIFKEGIREYLEGRVDCFEERRAQMCAVERQADEALRNIKYKLYAFMLIPDSRGDVYELVDALDNIPDTAKKTLCHFSLETPCIPPPLASSFLLLTEYVSCAVDEVVKATRAFFGESKMVQEYIDKVTFYEKEADKVEEKLRREVFSSNIVPDMAHKIHLRYFIEEIGRLANEAEQITYKLAVYVVKRAI